MFSTFILLSRFSSRIPSTNTALQYFKKKAMAEINSQFNFIEDQEMEIQPIYISSDESEIDSPPPSPIPVPAACNGLVYSVNLNGQNSGTQGYALPLFED